MVGGDSRGELRQDVPLPPLGDNGAGRAERGEFGGDLQGADRAARDEYTLAAVGRGSSVLVRFPSSGNCRMTPKGCGLFLRRRVIKLGSSDTSVGGFADLMGRTSLWL